MSIVNLATAYSDRYVNAPKARAMAAAAGNPAPAQPNAVTDPSTFSDNAKALAAYIPGDVLTLYLSATTAIQHWTFQASAAMTADQFKSQYVMIAFVACLIFTPIWAAVMGIIASSAPYSWKAWLWPALSGTIAFIAYSYAVPGSYLAPTDQNYGITASFAVLFVTPLLHLGGLLYTKFIKP